MKALVVTYDCKKGMRDDFYNAICQEGLGQACRDEDGNMRYEYARSAENPDRLILLEKWRDDEALGRHKEMAHFKRIGELKELYVDNTVLEIFEI